MTRARAPSKRRKKTSSSRSGSGIKKRMPNRAWKFVSRYSDKDFELIADSLGLLPERVRHLGRCFEAAAHWYFQDIPDPRLRRRSKPSDLQRKLLQIADSADRLLAHLGVADLNDAVDGPVCGEIFDALILADEHGTEDEVARSTAAIAQLLDNLRSVCAIAEIRGRAYQGARDVTEMSRLVVPKGFQGDRALNEWTIFMLGIYEHLTGIEAHLPLSRGAGTKLYAFLEAASLPLDLKHAQNWRNRVKTIVRAASNTPSAPI